MTTPSIPSSIQPPAEEGPIEEVVEAVEHVFSPRPGGMIDSWHKERARREAAQREAENAAEKVEEGAAYAVKVTQLQPELTAINIVTIAPGGNAMILPKGPYRYRACIAVITAASTVLLAIDQSQATSAIGFPLLTANPPFTTNSRGQLWASNPGGATVQVAVLAESYAAGK
jgi:hypothetical protein